MSTFSVPYTFVNGTVADGTQVNANFSAIVAAGNNINASNIGGLGIYASNIIPTTLTQGTFGGTQPYTFNNALIATPTSSTPTATTGTVWYDQTQDSLSYFNSTGFETNIGQEVDQVVYNGTGSTLNPGQAVYISGAGSGAYTAYAAVSLAIATSTSTANAIGVVGQTIANGSVGMIVILGRITNVNTTGWTTGQTLYLDYSTAGNLITTQPTSPYYAVRIGFVIVGGSSSGEIFVSVRNVYTLGSNVISPVVFTAFSSTSTPLTLNGVSSQIAPLFNVNTLASGGTNVFQIAASGAASFSNTVTANSGFVSSTGLTSGSSTYGPTSATVNGNITANAALTFGGSGGGAWSVFSNQVVLAPGASQTNGGYIANATNTSEIITWDNTGNLTSLGSFKAGLSTYGPTSATVNGNIVAQNALITEANGIGSYITGGTGAAGLLWNGTSGGGEATIVTAYNGGVTASFWHWNGSTYARSSVINSDGTYYNGSSYGPSSFTVAMGGSGQTSFTGVPNFGIRITPQSDGVGDVLYGTNAANSVINWSISDGGTFGTGSSTYGPTSASTRGTVTIGSNQKASIYDDGTNAYFGSASGGVAYLFANNGSSNNYLELTTANNAILQGGGVFATGSSTYGPSSITVAMGGSGQTSFTGVPSVGIRITPQSNGVGKVFYGTNAANSVVNWYINDDGTFGTGSSTYGPTSATVNGGITAYSLGAPSGNLLLSSGSSSASVIATNYNNGATGGFAVGNGGTGYYGTITSSGITTAGALITSLNASASGFPAGNNSYAGLAWNGTSGQAEAVIFTSYSSPGRTASFWYYNGSSYVQSSYIQTSGTYVAISDQTLKENIQPLAMGLKEVLALKPSSFTWKHNGKADHGFIAQEVQEVIPAAVEPMYAKDGEPDTNGILGMSYTHIIPVLVNAIQELKAELDSLKAAKNATA